jgi:perosamine synthetase
MALGICPGDEVIVPETTWIATAAPISYVGAIPIFVDIEPDSWCLSTDSVREVLNERTRAVIAVDLYGGCPDLVGLEALAAESGVHLIEDSAQAVGGRHAGKPAGSFGTTSAFSFHGSKTLTTGEGGMVFCDDDGLWERMLFLRDHGRPPGDTALRSTEVAWKYKMSEFQAAFGRVQLDRIEDLIARKRQIFDWYAERLADAPLTLNVERPGDRNTFWMVTAVLDATLGVTSQRLAEELKALNIATRPFFWPLSSLAAYGDSPDIGRARQRNRVSYELTQRGINFPSSLMLTEAQVDRVCEAITHIISAHFPTARCGISN